MSNSSKNKRTTPTILTVAKYAQVAPSTVSLYLSNPDRVSAKRQEKIQQAIDALDYTLNRSAGSLAARNNRLIAVIVPSVSNAFFAMAIKSMQDTCESMGYSMLLAMTDYDAQREIDQLRTLLQWAPAGIVLTGKKHHPKAFEMLTKVNCQMGQLWEIGGNKIKLQVGIDHLKVGEVLATHLHQMGIKKPLYLGTRMRSDWRAHSRYQGAKAYFGQHHLELDLLEVSTPHSVFEVGEQFVAHLKNNPQIDALISSNDELALAVLLGLKRAKYDVPGQIKVASFGDLNFSSATDPPLTTVTFPKSKIGEIMIRNLIARIEQPTSSFMRIDTGFDLIPRKSSASI
jgi:LacI family gluconate utilization system Gnt-I transcriptional repressor